MKAFLFDLDGTLTQTFYGSDTSFLKAISRQLDVDPNYAYWKDCPHLTDEYVLHFMFRQVLGRDANAKERAQMQHDFLQELQAKQQADPAFFEEIPGALNFTQQLMNQQITIGVATGGWQHVARYKLDLAGFSADIPLIGSDQYPTKKEFLQALKTEVCADLAPHDCIYIGDSPYDLRAAHELGMQFIGIDYRKRDVFKGLDVKHVFHDFKSPEHILNAIS